MIEFQNPVLCLSSDSTDGGLKNISPHDPGRQCVLLCGRSGCGRRADAAHKRPDTAKFFEGELSGKVLLDGEDVFGLPMHRIAEKVGSVFQNPRTQFFNVDTDSEIAFGMENGAVPQAEMKRRVAETAKALHIEPLLAAISSPSPEERSRRSPFASVYAITGDISAG